jgi:hypothetical protein
MMGFRDELLFAVVEQMVVEQSTMALLFNETDFLRLGLFVVGRKVLKSDKLARDRFQSSFGTQPVVVADLWHRLMDCGRRRNRHKCRPKHLLWALMFLKSYGKEMDMAARATCDEKTWRKWIWIVLSGINTMKCDVVSDTMIDTTDTTTIITVNLSHNFL